MSTSICLALLFIVGYLVPPILLVWGWLRWTTQPQERTVHSILSMTGFLLATISALLAISTIAYARVHRFAFYDPSLLRIFGWGALLSLSGIVSSIGGIWRRSSLRWHALASGLAMLVFWIVAASGE
jgi:hypothetical protein